MANLKEKICNGSSPTDVFGELIKLNPNIKNSELAHIFQDEFPDVSSEAVQVIWHWQRPGKRPGIEDERLNQHLVHLLKEAGYQIK